MLEYNTQDANFFHVPRLCLAIKMFGIMIQSEIKIITEIPVALGSWSFSS